jgi:hypothetical protein
MLGCVKVERGFFIECKLAEEFVALQTQRTRHFKHLSDVHGVKSR